MVQSKYSHSERENETYERKIWPKQDLNFWIKHWTLQFPVWHLDFVMDSSETIGQASLLVIPPTPHDVLIAFLRGCTTFVASLVNLMFHLPSVIRLSLSASLREIWSCHTLLGLCSYSTRPNGPIIIISPLLARPMLSALDVFWLFWSKVSL